MNSEESNNISPSPARAAFMAAASVDGLTDATDILYALRVRRGDKRVLSTLAGKHGNKKVVQFSQNISAARRNEAVLQELANYLGFAVRGVEPTEK